MLLFGGQLKPLGNSAAFVELGLDEAVEAYRSWGTNWRTEPSLDALPPAPMQELLRRLLPLKMPYDRRLLVGTTTGWTAIFDNSATGGDPFPPTYLATKRGVRAVAAGHTPDATEASLPATQFHLFGPDGQPPLMYVRTIDVGVFDDGPSWSFQLHGAQQPYEEPDAYERQRVRDRFTREMLIRYLSAVGIAAEDPSWYTTGVLADA